MEIKRLTRVDLRSLWKHEAHGFTRWLADNLDLVGETIDMQLSLNETEASVGTFALDILAEDSQGNLVVIENQLEATDHDHLGKVITYMSNLDAKIAIWISANVRPEHEKAVHWLNEILPEDSGVYLLKFEAYRIGDSPPAPLLTIVAAPSEIGHKTGEKKKELAERHRLRYEYWSALLEKARKVTALHRNISPGTDNWVSASAGISGLGFNYVILKDGARVECYIDVGDQNANKQIFDTLFAQREEIEKTFGESLEWQRLEDKRACRIACYAVRGRGLWDKEHWDEIQEKMINAMIRLEKALKPEIAKLKGLEKWGGNSSS